MVKRIPTSNQGKSGQRFKDWRRIEAEVLPSLPTPSHRFVLMVCWFHAAYSEGGSTVFDLTAGQVAAVTGLSDRHAKRILIELTSAGVLQKSKDGCNSGGRSLGAERRITFKPYPSQKGDTHGTVSSLKPNTKG